MGREESQSWDVVVIGAGCAGAMTAYLLGRQGFRVLLLDQAHFPRDKVCGGCLNASAIHSLETVGLLGRIEQLGAPTIRQLRLGAAGRQATLALPEGRAVSRFALDQQLILATREQGVTFWEGAMARLLPLHGETGHATHRQVSVRRRAEGESILQAQIVVAADGLSQSSVKRLTRFRASASRHARVGLGTRLPAAVVGSSCQRGEIVMAAGANGYVGMTRVEQDQLNVAAAVDPRAIREMGTRRVVQTILTESGFEPPDLSGVQWCGTLPLTRQPAAVSGERFFLVGDATGYVEPFTGEGMAWAFAAAIRLSQLVSDGIQHWQPSLSQAWESDRRRQRRLDQRCCRRLAWMLRRPRLVSAAITVARIEPRLVRPLIPHDVT